MARVEDASAVAACRNAVLTMAGRLEFPAARADQLALAVTEAASNLHKHACQGSLLLAVSRDVEAAGDRARHHRSGTRPGGRERGPAGRPFHRGDAGHRPGRDPAAGRLLRPVLRAGPRDRRWRPVLARPRPPEIRWAGLIRPITGETECGDAYGAVQAGDIVTGRAVRRPRPRPAGRRRGRGGGGRRPRGARTRAGRAAGARAPADERHPRRGRRHRAGHRPGGPVRGPGQHRGVDPVRGRRKSMLSVPGIAGYQARTIRQFEYEVPPGAAIILHSDGLSSRWERRRPARPGRPGIRWSIAAVAAGARRGYTATMPACSCSP